MSYYFLSTGAKAVLKTLEKHFQNGDAYISKEQIWKLCKRGQQDLTQRDFTEYLQELFHENFLYLDGMRLYLKRIWQCEEATANTLANILRGNIGRLNTAVPTILQVGDVTLTSQQRDAVSMACQHRLSCILGGAGTGKSTLIHCLSNVFLSHGKGVVLCAPTGKGARNITMRTGYPARTVHSALGKTPDDDDFLAEVQWQETDLVVIDEASMLSLELLAGILTIASPLCTIVLVGDPNQLLSVGSGNVMADLLALGVPQYTLTTHHRQEDKTSALAHNVEQFNQCRRLEDLRFDDSFVFQTDLQTAEKTLCAEATSRYLAGENMQVLAPFNASVQQLNGLLQESVNQNPTIKDCPFRISDRVMVVENDWQQGVLNGDIGVYRQLEDKQFHQFLGFQGQVATWDGLPLPLTLAYAITVHKAQGSEYDTVLIPICKRSPILTRNWIYTAISRGKKKVILYGDPDVLNYALHTPPKPRASMLVTKTRQRLATLAG